jgi:hypothetical protein
MAAFDETVMLARQRRKRGTGKDLDTRNLRDDILAALRKAIEFRDSS